MAELLSDVAYNEHGLEKIIYTAKDENIQSQKSIAKTVAKLIGVHDGYHFYSLNLEEKYKSKKKH